MFRINILGSLEVHRDGDTVEGLAATTQAVLGLLTLYDGQPVSGQRLLSRLCLDSDRAGRRKLLRALDHIEELVAGERGIEFERRADASSQILHLPTDASDLARSRAMVTRARRAAPDRAAALYAAALALWRGPALVGLAPARAWPEQAALALEHDMLREDRAAARLAMRDVDDELLEELSTLMAEHPDQERWSTFLMEALTVLGRTDEARAVYRTASSTLSDRWGLDPGAELSRRNDRLQPGSVLPGREHGQEIAILVVSRLRDQDREEDDRVLTDGARDHGGTVVWQTGGAMMAVFAGVVPHESALDCAQFLADWREGRALRTATTISICSGDAELFEPENALSPYGGVIVAGPALAAGREQFFGAPVGVIVVDDRTRAQTGSRARWGRLPLGHRLIGRWSGTPTGERRDASTKIRSCSVDTARADRPAS